jgi:ribosomal protein S18 acetylase RimI-like enzyme
MKDEPFIIRKAKANDFSACLPLFKSLYHGDIGPDFKHTFEDFVNNHESIVLLAEQSNKVIGILMGSYHLDIDWEGKTAKIDAIIINENSRRTGIGKRLMNHFITEAKDRKCKAVVSRVNKENRIAQIFHENLGFTKANTCEYILDLQ